MTHYDLLGVAPDATTEEIHRAYLRLARQHHPDVGGTTHTAHMQALNEAWGVLGDHHRRRVYDVALAAARPEHEHPPFRPAPIGHDDADPAEAESDEPLGPPTTSRQRAMLPVALFAMALVTFCVGVVTAAAPLLALAVLLLLAAGGAFVIVPFLAMAGSRRHDRLR